jgi:hypothetical protein
MSGRLSKCLPLFAFLEANLALGCVPSRTTLAAAAFHPKVDRAVVSLLRKAGWTWGYVSAIDSNERTIFVADAHRGDGKRFVVRADEKLTAFVEMESAIRQSSGWLLLS